MIGYNSFKRIDLATIDSYVDSLLCNIICDCDGKNPKERALETITSFPPNSGYSSYLKNALEIAEELLEEVREGLHSNEYITVMPAFVLKGPGLAGIGGGLFKPAFEVGLTVDSVLGLPYYPGSTIKGALRGFLEQLSNNNDLSKLAKLLFGWKAEEKAEDHDKTGHIGPVFISDMLPIGGVKSPCSIYRGLVVNPHYYKGGVPVEDELEAKPVPIKHVGIEEGTVFKLVVGVRLNDPIVGEAHNILKKALNDQTISVVLGTQAQNKIQHVLDSPNPPVTVLLAVVVFLSRVLSMGIAARSGRGYNVFAFISSVPKLELKIQGYRFKGRSHGSRR